jgi:hypothetical protein
MTFLAIMSMVHIALWLAAFVLWIMSTYHRDYKVEYAEQSLAFLLNPYKRRKMFKDNIGFIYHSLAWTFFLIGCISSIICGFWRY